MNINIFERYEKYRKQHATEFREILKRVAKELLIVSENIPEEIALEEFRVSANRRYLFFEEKLDYSSSKKVVMSVAFSDTENMQCSYDDSAVKELDEFMETYYPGVTCCHKYTLDLYRKNLEFKFTADIEFNEEDVNYSLNLFNDDLAELLQDKSGKATWLQLRASSNPYVYESGCAVVAISIG